MKKCSKCRKKKSLSDFSKDKTKSDGYYPSCNQCRNKLWKERYIKSKGIPQRRCALKQKFNLTIEDYDKMFEVQKGVCAICGREQLNRRLAVDHNHQTGKVRKLLCTRCNTLVGHFEDREFLVKAILKYLKEN